MEQVLYLHLPHVPGGWMVSELGGTMLDDLTK